MPSYTPVNEVAPPKMFMCSSCACLVDAPGKGQHDAFHKALADLFEKTS